jgi:hypothetical protein
LKLCQHHCTAFLGRVSHTSSTTSPPRLCATKSIGRSSCDVTQRSVLSCTYRSIYLLSPSAHAVAREHSEVFGHDCQCGFGKPGPRSGRCRHHSRTLRSLPLEGLQARGFAARKSPWPCLSRSSRDFRSGRVRRQRCEPAVNSRTISIFSAQKGSLDRGNI